MLCLEGKVLSAKTRISEGLIGVVFLAIATSFPEITTAVTSVFFLDKVGLGYGDILGSVIVNFMMLAGIDYLAGRGRVLLRVSRLNRLTGYYICLFAVIVTLSAVSRTIGMDLVNLWNIGIESAVILVLYVSVIRVLHRSGEDDVNADMPAPENPVIIWGKFTALLLIVLFLGALLAHIGDIIVRTTDFSQTFTGTIFLGIATSLPELIVSFAALRAGSVDMAVGNILGSNLFDICIIPVLDMVCADPILGVLTYGQVLITVIFMAMSVVFAGSVLIKKDTGSRLNVDTMLIFTIGFVGFVIIYYLQ